MPKKQWKAFATPDQISVPAADDMDDETFLKHLELRHAEEVKFETSGVGRTARRAMSSWLPTYRAFHARLHQIAMPGQYDHVHEDEG